MMNAHELNVNIYDLQNFLEGKDQLTAMIPGIQSRPLKYLPTPTKSDLTDEKEKK